MEGARLLALLIYFEGRGEGRGAIAPLKREALVLGLLGSTKMIRWARLSKISNRSGLVGKS